jgi:membrane protease YdiL (CAAX protease family)
VTTAATVSVERSGTSAHATRLRTAIAVLIACGLAALWLRPTLTSIADAPLVLAVLFGGLLALGLVVPLPDTARVQPLRVLAVTAVGVAAVGAAQLLVGHPRVIPLPGRFVFLDIVAAIAEEAFFRRLVFGMLRPYGAQVAIVGSAALFAVVHLTTYGAWVLPLDFAVGLLFGWQREASGTWVAPAVTHVLANLLVVW